jgi:hypothetical protein
MPVCGCVVGRGLSWVGSTFARGSLSPFSVCVCWCSARKLQVSAEEEGSKLAGMVLAMDNVMTALRYSTHTNIHTQLYIRAYILSHT